MSGIRVPSYRTDAIKSRYAHMCSNGTCARNGTCAAMAHVQAMAHVRSFYSKLVRLEV